MKSEQICGNESYGYNRCMMLLTRQEKEFEEYRRECCSFPLEKFGDDDDDGYDNCGGSLKSVFDYYV